MSSDELGMPAMIHSVEELNEIKPPPPPRSSLKERLITSLIGWVPGPARGHILRRLLYRSIFAKIGNSVFIDRGVAFAGTSNIELGDSVVISPNVNINAAGENNKISIGYRVGLLKGVNIVGLENTTVEIGDRTFINVDVWINGPGHIKIGEDCLLAPRVSLIAVNHIFSDLKRPINIQGHTAKGITIEDDCWLGFGVTVVDGVTVGKGSVIGAGAVVTKDIPPYSIAVGVPAKVVGKRGE